MGLRSHRLNDSLGSSWGDAEYSSGDVESAYSTSDLSEENDTAEQDNETVYRPVTRSSKTKQGSANESLPTTLARDKDQNSKAYGRASKTSQNSWTSENTSRPLKTRRAPARSEHPEPSFIMPTVDYSYDQPAAHDSRTRQRHRRQPSHRSRRQNPTSDYRRQSSHRTTQQEVGPWYFVGLLWENLLLPLLGHTLDIFSYAFRHFIKPALGIAVGVGILALAIQSIGGFLGWGISNALVRPICLIPGSSRVIPFCTTAPLAQSSEEQVPNFERLVHSQDKVDQLVGQTLDLVTMPYTLRDSQSTMRDLRQLVVHSHLPSKHLLELDLGNYITTALEAVNVLTTYHHKIVLLLDAVVIRSSQTATYLDELAEAKSSNTGVHRMFNAMSELLFPPTLTLKERIFNQYISHIDDNQGQITKLLKQGQDLENLLQSLDGHLVNIHLTVLKDGMTIGDKHEELLAAMWTKLGGNKRNKKENENSIALLNNINHFRKDAVDRIGHIGIELKNIMAELDNLKEGISAPILAGYKEEVPLQNYIELVRNSEERLRWKARAHRDQKQAHLNAYRNPEEVLALPEPSAK